MIAGLLVIELLTILIAVWLNGEKNQEVAVIGDTAITKQELWGELEERYGSSVLRDLVNEEVIGQAAQKNDISVSDEELETELTFIKARYGSYDQQYLQTSDWEEQIRANILLEKLLVQDVEIPERDVKAEYTNNKDKYKTPTAYHLSHIVVDEKKQAQQIYEELKDGASFPVLAMEQSRDDASASQDGDIGYITKKSSRYPSSYVKKAADLKPGKYSKPIKLDDGYAIIFLHEKVKGKTFSYKEVKSMIERQLAVAQMNGAVNADYFWDELGVDWLYGAKE